MSNQKIELRLALREYDENFIEIFDSDKVSTEYRDVYYEPMIGKEISNVIIVTINESDKLSSIDFSAVPLCYLANIIGIYGECLGNKPEYIMTSFENMCYLKEIVLKNIIINPEKSAFKNCTSLERISAPVDTCGMESLKGMFQGCFKLKQTPELNVEKCTDISFMFMGCESLQSIEFIGIPKLNEMFAAFKECHSLTQIPKLDTTCVKNMAYSFEGCELLKEIPSLNYSSLEEGCGTFCGCISLEKIPKMEFLNLENGSDMFSKCTNLKSASLICPNLECAFDMFRDCSSLESNPLKAVGFCNLTGIFTGTKIAKENIKVEIPVFNLFKSLLDEDDTDYSKEKEIEYNPVELFVK